MLIVRTMNYGRETVGNFLRKAGDSIRNFDEAYGKRVSEIIRGNEEQPSGVRNVSAIAAGWPARISQLEREPGDENLPRTAVMAMRAAQVGLPAIGATVRYGLPAAGVTAAGVGLYDLTQSMSQQTEGTMNMN